MKLDGKVAVVTGAGGGIGRTMANALAEEGAHIVAADIDTAKAEATADDVIAKGAEAISVTTDVSDTWSLTGLVEEVVTAFGGVDILVNNAGRHLREYYRKSTEIDEDAVRELFSVNVLGTLFAVRACLPSMRMRGGGVIVNRSSVAAYAPRNAYAASKLAVGGLTIALADELAPDHIRVNALAIGLLDTSLTMKALSLDQHESVVAQQKLHRHGRLEDVIGPLLFLATDDSAFVTGQTVVVDGGRVDRI